MTQNDYFVNLPRKESIRLNHKYSYPMRKCSNGHISAYYSKSSTCCECALSRAKKQRDENPEEIREYKKQYRKDNREKIILDLRKRYAENKDVHLENCRKYRMKNVEKKRKANKVYRESNKHKRNKYHRERYAIDVGYKSSFIIRRHLKRIVKSLSDPSAKITTDSLGYTPEEFSSHIESLFKTGMSWDNYGDWHIDHIKPISAFIKEGVTDPRTINALSNLQPLWAYENLAKGDKWGK